MKKNHVSIEKVGMDIGQAKDLENTVANSDKIQATIDYICACDYPEVFESEAGENE